MNIAEASIKYKTIVLVMTVFIIGGGIIAYERLARLEDPEFTIKTAQVYTTYPGATAMEVSEEVTNEIEKKIQELGQLKRITSISQPGLSIIQVEIKDKYDKYSLPQVWDELRRKVNDVQSSLPPGATPSVVNDDYGDVYGVFFAVYGDGYTYAELKDFVDVLRRELLLCKDVAKVTLQGNQPETVYVEISRAKLSQLGISPEAVYASLAGQNLVVPSGKVEVGSEYIRISPTGEFESIEEIGNLLLLQGGKGSSKLYLKDIATIRRGYTDPPQMIMHFNGRPAIGLGISTVLGGNVVTMGRAVKKRLMELKARMPIGMEFGLISNQAESVTTSINGFIVNLVEALLIVIGVLMVAMGLRSGILIGVILLLTILATFIFMKMWGIMLERISLGALIIALGMLVDNAIVVVDGILVGMQRGKSRIDAAKQIVGQTMWPLFGATVVAVLAFAAIGTSQDSTGEYCRSLFQVMLISLMASWVMAITVTPLLGVMFLKIKSVTGDSQEQKDPYSGLMYRVYKKLLIGCIRLRWVTMAVMAGLLALAMYGFGYVDRTFFPDAPRPQFMIHCWMPQGTHITKTAATLKKMEEYVRTIDGVTDVSAFSGGGSLRFLLTYSPEDKNDAYGMLLVNVEDFEKMDEVIAPLQKYFEDNYPNAQTMIRSFMLGPGDANKIQARFRGRDPDVLRKLAAKAKKIILADPIAADMMDDWRSRVPLVRPVVAETQARDAGITRSNIANALQIGFTGLQIGVYREGRDLLPIMARAPAVERDDVANIHSAQIWSPVAGQSIPISQVLTGYRTSSENTIIRRRNRLPCLTIMWDPREGPATVVFDKLRPKIEAIPLPEGYTMEWGGEYEDSNNAQAGLQRMLPIVGILIVLTVICLFNAIRQPLIIFLTVPLALIGVTAGLLLFKQPFGFMALLGFMSLVGMQIKQAIVLIDETDHQLKSDEQPFDAIVNSGLSRIRPVVLAALTTVLGMIPLLPDVFFVSMAVTIMFGLAFAAMLTLIVVPVLYSIFFRIKYVKPEEA